MAELFEQNETEYSRHISAAQRRLRSLPSAASGDKRRLELHALDKEVERAEHFLQKMEYEARTSLSLRSRLEARVRNYQGELDSLRRDVDRAKSQGRGAQEMTSFASLDQDAEVRSLDQRQRLLQINQQVDDQTQRLVGANQMSHQNEQIGAEILEDLYGNRETLIRVTDKLDDIQDNMSIGRRFINTMTWRAYQSKFILICIIILELAALGVIIWLKAFH